MKKSFTTSGPDLIPELQVFLSWEVDCHELFDLFKCKYLFPRLLVVWCRHLAGPVLLLVWGTGGERESKSFTNI